LVLHPLHSDKDRVAVSRYLQHTTATTVKTRSIENVDDSLCIAVRNLYIVLERQCRDTPAKQDALAALLTVNCSITALHFVPVDHDDDDDFRMGEREDTLLEAGWLLSVLRNHNAALTRITGVQWLASNHQKTELKALIQRNVELRQVVGRVALLAYAIVNRRLLLNKDVARVIAKMVYATMGQRCWLAEKHSLGVNTRTL